VIPIHGRGLKKDCVWSHDGVVVVKWGEDC
jgi:hypothetical protein